MHRLALLSLAASTAAFLGVVHTSVAHAAEPYRISGPVVHENLAIYFVHGSPDKGPVPLTLQEAMAKGSVKVHETGNVNELSIENTGNAEVFVQSGDIVKGGQQDRVLMVSLVLQPKSGRVPIASFCVEQGRWTARGKEDVRLFGSSDAAVPSREAKLAMKAPARPAPARTAPVDAVPAEPHGVTGTRTLTRPLPSPHAGVERGRVQSYATASGDDVGTGSTGERQRAVWANVAKVQQKLAGGLGATVAAPQSASSLQLSLENEKLKDAQDAYIKALQGAGEKGDDIVGYVFAINGKLNSADLYPSNGLFRKMWPKLLKANATEAIGEKKGAAETLPTTEAVLAFLTAAEAGKASEKDVTASVKLETRDADTAFLFETRRASGGWVHRNYLAK